MSSEAEATELLPCSFKFHEFVIPDGELSITVEIMKMENSFYFWIGDKSNALMNDMSYAFPSEYDSLPVSINLMSNDADAGDTSVNVARRLTHKLGKPVYISFNLPWFQKSLLEIEKSIHEELIIFLDKL